ncbi:MAG: hypothetical protein FD166_3816, partial [Bacteroidetes bacterium]
KIVHFIIYLLLALMMYYGWKKQITFPSLYRHTLLKILVITFAYGFLVEILQEKLTADRHFDLMDALANSSGAVAGSWISPYFLRKIRRAETEKN